MSEQLRVKKFTIEDSATPYVEFRNGKGDYFLFWANTNEQAVLVPTQARFIDATRNFLLMFYNPQGVLQRIQSEQSGEFLIIDTTDEAMIVKAYEGNGIFAGGFKVTKKSGKYYAAPVLGRPFFVGQVTLALKGASKSISAVLLPEDETATGVATELPASLQTFVEAQNIPGEGNFSLSAATLGSGLTNLTSTNRIALAAAFTPHVLTSLLNEKAAKIAKPLLDAGLAAGLSWQLANGFQNSSSSLAADFGSRFEKNESLSTAIEGQVGMITGSGALASLRSAPLNESGKMIGNALKSDPKFLKTPEILPVTSVPVSGFSVDNDGATVNLTGTVSGTGQLTASGTSDAGRLTIGASTSNRLTSGTFSGYLGNGGYVGRVDPLGSCQSQQKSGGQGTYVKAHYMNNSEDKGAAGSGTTVFSYNAFGIPDQFTVFTLDGKKFGTQGLVSGISSADIPVPKNWIVIVSVNAPEDDTAWEYDLSCPQ